MTKFKWIQDINFYGQASIPIIKVDCQYKGLDVVIDITQHNENHKGLMCIQLVQSYIKAYPSLKPLVLVLKNLIKIHQLNDPYHGGLSSYGILLLVVAYIQQYGESQSLGSTLINILRTYSQSYRYIQPYSTTESVLRQTIWEYNVFGMMGTNLEIRDPLNSQNNVAKTCFQFQTLFRLFEYGYYSIMKGCTCQSHCQEVDMAKQCHESNLNHLFLTCYKQDQLYD